MSVLLVLLGKAIRLGSIAAYVYLLWNGRWLVIVTAIGFSFLTPAITALVNLPMGVFWKELGYPEALTTPGLQLLVNPVRLLMVSRIPQLVYGGLAYAIGLAAFLLFSSSSHALERAALMITGYETGFAVPTVLAATLIAQGKSQGAFLSSQLFYGKMAFLTLLIVHSIMLLAFWPAAALLAVAMLVLEYGFEVAAWRKPLTDIISGLEAGK
jgi:hypothetical protein